jgi:hypothetical protein
MLCCIPQKEHLNHWFTNRVGDSYSSPEKENGPSFRKVFSSYLESRMTDKYRNPVILSSVRHRQNRLESIDAHVFSLLGLFDSENVGDMSLRNVC